jgi:uncharacterized damage-inducible protein DinB
MISLEIALKHMAWSNQKLFHEIGELPSDIYQLKVAEGEWPIGQLLTHLIGAAEWYRYCLTSEPWGEVIPINNHEILSLEAGKLVQLDHLLVNQAQLDDDLMTFEDENGPSTYRRSVILTQAQMHAAEHKGQIATILKMHGHHLDLDKHDVWAYTRQKD